MLVMENAEEVLQILERFSKLKQKIIPKELNEYLIFVAKTGDTVFRWPMIKYLFREKLSQVIHDFRETTSNLEAIPHNHNLDLFNYEPMKNALIERLEGFHAAPFTVQRLCELLTDPRKQYSRIDKFMRAIEKNILVVTTTEPGRKRGDSENADSIDSVVNGDVSSESVDSDETDIFFTHRHSCGEQKHKMLVAEITKNLLDSMDSEKEKDKYKDDNEIKVDTETEATENTTTPTTIDAVTATASEITTVDPTIKQDDENLDADRKKLLDAYDRTKLTTPDTKDDISDALEATSTTTTSTTITTTDVSTIPSNKTDTEEEQRNDSCEGKTDTNNKIEKIDSEPIRTTSEKETINDEIVEEFEKDEVEAEVKDVKQLIDTTTIITETIGAVSTTIDKLKDAEEDVDEEEMLLLPDEDEILPNSTETDNNKIKDIKLIPIIITGIDINPSVIDNSEKLDDIDNEFSLSSVSDDKSDNSNDALIEKDEENLSSDASSSEIDDKEKIDKDDNLLEDYISESDTKSSEDDSELSTDIELKQETKKIKLSDDDKNDIDKNIQQPDEKKIKLHEIIVKNDEIPDVINQDEITSSDLTQNFPIPSIITSLSSPSSSTSNSDITSTDDLLLINKEKIINKELDEIEKTVDEEIFMESTTTEQLIIDDIKLQSDDIITTSIISSSSSSPSLSILFPSKIIHDNDDSNVLSTTTITPSSSSSSTTNEIIMHSNDTLEMDTSIQTITQSSTSSITTEVKMSTDEDELITAISSTASSSLILTNKLDDTAMDVDEAIEPMDQ